MKKWQIVAEENGDLFPATFLFETLKENSKAATGIQSDNWMLRGKDGAWEFIVEPESWELIASTVYQKLKKDKKFLTTVRQKIIHHCQEMIEASGKIHGTDLTKLNNQQLFGLFQAYRQKNKIMYIWGMIPVFVDFWRTRLSNEVREIIKNKVQDKALAAEYFITLTSPEEDNLIAAEEKSFLNLALKILQNQKAKELFEKPIEEIRAKLADFPEIDALINEHFEEFCFFGYGYVGPAWTKDYYLERLAGFIMNGGNPERELFEKAIKKAETKKAKKALIGQLGFTDDEIHLIKIAEEFTFLKVHRKDLLYKSYHHVHNWLGEVAKRFNLTVRQLRHMLSEEMEEMLLANKAPDKELLNQRIQYFTLTLQNGRLFLLHGEEAEQFYNKLVEKTEIVATDELKGECASQGKATGIIKLIRIVEDMKKMNKGDILISPATNPNLVPAMEKAAAIVTDEGGITCHAAIVSREMGIPCVTGTKVVTKAFKDGDKVEIDATHGIIRRIK